MHLKYQKQSSPCFIYLFHFILFLYVATKEKNGELATHVKRNEWPIHFHCGVKQVYFKKLPANGRYYILRDDKTKAIY